MKRDTYEFILSSTIKSLKELRESQGMTHSDLAKKAGMSRSAISHIEAGTRKPSLVAALRIAESLGVELSHVISNSPEGPK